MAAIVAMVLSLRMAGDSSSWPEKQYAHKRAGTRQVATRRPNAWGSI